jgi:hypothetical protein
MMIRLLLAACASIAVAASTLHAQGVVSGFMQGAGRTTVAVSGSTEWYDQYFVADRRTDNNTLGTISTTSVSLYAAAGITSWLDVVANVPYVRASSSAGFWSPIGGFQDVTIGLRGRPLALDLGRGRLDVFAAAMGILPMTEYPTDMPVTIGHGASGMDMRLGAQYNAWSGVFISAQMGYTARGRVEVDRGFEVDVPDAVDAVIRGGWSDGTWYTDVWWQNINAQSGTNIGAGVPFPSNGQSIARVGATLAYRLMDQFSLVGAAAGTLSGRNVGQATRLSFGIVYDLPTWSGISF